MAAALSLTLTMMVFLRSSRCLKTLNWKASDRNLDGIDFRLGPSNLSQMVTDSWVEDGDSGDFNGDGFIDLIISIAPSHNEDRSRLA